MDLKIAEFCANNAMPPDDIIQEINRSLVEPVQDLKVLDDEILALHRRLEYLKSKRTVPQEWISRYQSVLSPIRRLPSDVLLEIFDQCLDFHTNPILDETQCPILLTRVCKSWRGMALSETRLWSRIHMTFADPVYTAQNAPELRAKDQQILTRRLAAMKLWISRAGRRPLSVSVHFPESGNMGNQYSITTKKFIQYLAQISPRVMELDLTMPLAMYRRFEDMITVCRVTQLVSLRLSLPTLNSRQAPIVDPILLLSAPNLRRLSMAGTDPKLLGIFAPFFRPGWDKLTEISCNNQFTIAAFTTLLSHCRNLVHFSVTIFGATPNPVPYQGRISLPFLRTLFITDYLNYQARGGLYEHIDAPALKWVMFESGIVVLPGDPQTPIVMPILSLLKKATGLKKLSINPPFIGAWDIDGLFKAVPQITHLFIGNESRAIDGSLQRINPVRAPDVNASDDLFDFQLLSSSDNPPLLPKLQRFEINKQAIQFREDHFFNFIKYRMAPPPGSGISTLKHAAAVFYRSQVQKISTSFVDSIRQHAEVSGVEMIDLALNFLQPQEDKTRVPKTDLGLMKLEAFWGNHGDADNYIHYHSHDLEMI